MDTKSPFIAELVNIQELKHYSDGEMANRIGCSRQLYQATRNGKIPLGMTILRGGLNAFPQLRNVAVILAEVVDRDTPEKPSERRYKRFLAWLKRSLDTFLEALD